MARSTAWCCPQAVGATSSPAPATRSNCAPGSCPTAAWTSTGCGGGAACAPGRRCLNGTCIDPCENIHCGPPSICAGGLCTGGSCYSTGCGSGLVCQNGLCVTDPCAGLACPSGTFCRAGDCVQSCVYVSCAVGQRCGADGFCVADPCAAVSCDVSNNKICNLSTGACETNLCAGLSCGAGQLCDQGACKDDPCATIDCSVGVCWRGQCYSTSNPRGLGTEGARRREAVNATATRPSSARAPA